MRKLKNLSHVITICLILFGITSCNLTKIFEKKGEEKKEKLVENSTKDTKNEKEDNEEDTEEEEAEDNDKPSKLPEDVPFFENSKVSSEYSTDNKYVLSYTAKASTTEVFRYYQDELKAQGWKLQLSVNVDIPGLGGSIAPITAKKDERSCIVTIAGKNDDECTVEVTTTKK